MITQVSYKFTTPEGLQRSLYRTGPQTMLRFGGFPPQCNTSHRSGSSKSLHFPNKINQTRISFLSNKVTQLGICTSLGQMRNGFRVYASRTRREGGGNSVLEMEGSVDEDEDDNGDDDEYEDDNDDEVVIPSGEMKRWFENKPRGFGEGKVYDTSVEDKLFEEMEQSRQAQIANINNLKNNPENPNSKKDQRQKQQGSEDVPRGFRVRLTNLPKKKNIHRDLQLAFKEVPGILNIIPAVTGNKKTRDPISKGFAFVDFKSEDAANRFIEIFSRQSITFGKTQKQIKCETMNPSFSKPAYEQLVDETNYARELAVPSLEGKLDTEFTSNDSSSVSQEESVSNEYEGVDYENLSTQMEDNGENLEALGLSKSSSGDSVEQRKESKTNSSSSKQKQKSRVNGKKQASKGKNEKISKLKIPGSANKLKIREKALLSGVFSKYGALAMKEER